MLVFDLKGTPIHANDANLFVEYLAAVSYAIWSAYHQLHGHSLAQLVFGRDIFLPISAEVDWNAIKNCKQLRVKMSNDRENSKQVPHDWLFLVRDKQLMLRLFCLIDLKQQ